MATTTTRRASPRPPSRRPQPTRGRARRARRGPGQRSWIWRYRRLLFLLGLGGFTFLAGAAWVVTQVPLPRASRPLAQNTFVRDASGGQLAVFRGPEDRELVRLDEVPKPVQDAVIAAEDRKYFRHKGVDPLGIARATWADIRHGQPVQGGSTITQQYVKNTYVGKDRTLLRKLKEAVIAVKLERRYDKREILERYLNTVYFGRGAYGVKAAARVYFGKDLSAIQVHEAAYLATLVRHPERGGVADDEGARRARRGEVLLAMVKTRAIGADVQAYAAALPLGVIPPPSLEAAPTEVQGADYFVDYVRRDLIRRFGEDLVFRGGLRVETTLDPRRQEQAYESVYDTLHLEDGPDGALVALDPDGSVVAMVGGRDYGADKTNLAVGREGGGTGRQPGSTFKPMVLAETVRAGYTVESSFKGDAEVVLPKADQGNDWEVHNFEEAEFPRINLIEATANSVNTVYAQLITSLPDGPQKTVEMARLLGVKTDLRPLPAIALGAQEVSVLDMADAYLTFANRGLQVDPQVVTKVTRADGSVLFEARPKRNRVLQPGQADIVNFCLRQVVEHGSGSRADIGKPMAGKTGTTENNADAWFIGYTPKLTAAVWMGYPDGNEPMRRLYGYDKVTGASVPATIFQKFMNRALADVDPNDFPEVDDFGGDPLPESQILRYATPTTAPPVTRAPVTSAPAPTVPPASVPTPVAVESQEPPVTAGPRTRTSDPPATAGPPSSAPQGPSP